MRFEIYQWLVPLIAVFFIIRTARQFFYKKRSLRSLLIWLSFWITISALAIVPNEISVKIAKILGFKSNVNAIIFVALGLLFIFVFYLSTTLERMETQMTELVRKMAIEEHIKKIEKEAAEQELED